MLLGMIQNNNVVNMLIGRKECSHRSAFCNDSMAGDEIAYMVIYDSSYNSFNGF